METTNTPAARRGEMESPLADAVELAQKAVKLCGELMQDNARLVKSNVELVNMAREACGRAQESLDLYTDARPACGEPVSGGDARTAPSPDSPAVDAEPVAPTDTYDDNGNYTGSVDAEPVGYASEGVDTEPLYYAEKHTLGNEPAYKLYQRGCPLGNGYGHPLWLMYLTDGDANFDANVKLITDALIAYASAPSDNHPAPASAPKLAAGDCVEYLVKEYALDKCQHPRTYSRAVNGEELRVTIHREIAPPVAVAGGNWEHVMACVDKYSEMFHKYVYNPKSADTVEKARAELDAALVAASRATATPRKEQPDAEPVDYACLYAELQNIASGTAMPDEFKDWAQSRARYALENAAVPTPARPAPQPDAPTCPKCGNDMGLRSYHVNGQHICHECYQQTPAGAVEKSEADQPAAEPVGYVDALRKVLRDYEESESADRINQVVQFIERIHKDAEPVGYAIEHNEGNGYYKNTEDGMIEVWPFESVAEEHSEGKGVPVPLYRHPAPAADQKGADPVRSFIADAIACTEASVTHGIYKGTAHGTNYRLHIWKGDKEPNSSKPVSDSLEASVREVQEAIIDAIAIGKEFGYGDKQIGDVMDARDKALRLVDCLAYPLKEVDANPAPVVATQSVVEEIREAMGDVLKLSLNSDSPFTLKAVAKFDAALGKIVTLPEPSGFGRKWSEGIVKHYDKPTILDYAAALIEAAATEGK